MITTENERYACPSPPKKNTVGVLIIGSDSQIGSALNEYLIKNNIATTGTTRRKEKTNKNTLYLDLENPNYDLFNVKYDSVVICAATTNIAQCEKEPNKHKIINVTNTIKLIEKLAGNGSFIVYLSSNAVFNGEKAFYKHNDTTCPVTTYGKFKNEVEDYLTENLKKNSCILRLTKVITKNTSFIERWVNEAAANLNIRTYTNKLLSPINIENVVDALESLITQQRFGIYHLGGSIEISYADYAKDYFKNNPQALKLLSEDLETTENNKITHNSLSTHLPRNGHAINFIKYDSSSIKLIAHPNKSLLNSIKDDIQTIFKETDDFYIKLPIKDYRKLVNSAQDLLNKRNYPQRICDVCESEIKAYLGEERFYVQSNLYLRATRPSVEQESESVGWHRETFYGPNMERSANIWTPIKGVNNLNTLQFIPNSHNIPESDIITTQINDKVTTKGSIGNKIGFLYAPKTIIKGVDFNKATRMEVPPFHSALFPSLLIHGAANNFSQNIRFSIDFRIIPHSAYDIKKSKQHHFASNNPYFIPY